MTGIKDYDRYDALDLAQLIRRRELSASEVLEEAIARTEAANPRLNAVVAKVYDAARARAKQPLPDTALAGVPFLIKDITYVAGTPCTSGSRLFADAVPDHDSEIVARYRAAGLVLFGKTSTPEFGLNVTTESVLFGACRNPWNLQKTTGGSSGGAGAVVAAGVIPAAHATDGGGSIRIPASCCGLVGLKPTRARNPQGPDAGEGWGGMSTGHIVSRTVRDSAAFLDATHGPAPGDPYHAPTFVGSFLGQCAQSPRRLRIALDTHALTGVPTHPDCIGAARHAASLCESLGHVVEEASPEFDRLAFRVATGVVVSANVANAIDARLATLGRKLGADDVETNTRANVEYGRSLTAPRYAAAMQTIHQVSRAVARFHQTYDVMLTPTLVAPPVPLGWLDTMKLDVATFSDRFSRFWGFTNLQNATGQPAISLPLYWNNEELPIGVQFVGRFGDDLLMLQLASQLERAQPWFDRRPKALSA
jgi:Asp-tRNA(Asn)/Glu-tRNA(Gln) amidotransferase A subunit family amidase